MNQKEGVFAAVTQVFGDVDGAVPPTGQWTDKQSEAVHTLVLQGFKSGSIEYKGGIPDDTRLMKYIPGLVNNWVRKDTRLNGGTKYETKRPGSRSGTGDESVREMRKLLAVTTDPAIRTQIQAAIDARIEALKPKVEINAEALPENLRHLVKAA